MNKGNGTATAELVDRSQVTAAIRAFADPVLSFELRSFPPASQPSGSGARATT